MMHFFTGESFLPWMLGFQMFEKMFRVARSMSSTFFTTINFAMLGLLRRLHRLHSQVCLESQTDSTGIQYQPVEAHKKKDGVNKQDKLPVLLNFSCEDIANAVNLLMSAFFSNRYALNTQKPLKCATFSSDFTIVDDLITLIY